MTYSSCTMHKSLGAGNSRLYLKSLLAYRIEYWLTINAWEIIWQRESRIYRRLTPILETWWASSIRCHQL